MTETFLDGRVVLHCGDNRDVLRGMPDNSVDSIVTDPPYHLTSIVNRFGKNGSAPAQFGADGRFARLSGGFMNQAWDAPDEIPPIDPGFAHWLAGFIDGEGCFHVHKKRVNDCDTYDCQFSINLRADDADIIAEIQSRLGGIGTIASRKVRSEGNGKPQVRYCVSSKSDCMKLHAILSAFPLRAKKKRDFEIWSQALDAWINHEPGASWEDVAYFRDALMAVRRFGSDYHPSQLFFYRWARECLRVLKPGGHLVAFAGTRTYHRMTVAIEDAGFEIRDMIAWTFGSGFPKSHDVSKGIDRAMGAERRVIAQGKPVKRMIPGADQNKTGWEKNNGREFVPTETAAGSPEAATWEGWGTALKPAIEPICLARKPLSGTVAQNVLEHGTGALNIDGCRIGDEPITQHGRGDSENIAMAGRNYAEPAGRAWNGRWPANLVHDGSEEVLAAFPDDLTSGKPAGIKAGGQGVAFGHFNGGIPVTGFGDSGSAARFFYTAKADADDRLGSKHPTVKPVDLMQWLCRLVTPKGGTILDPFAGTGTTAEACFREGMRCILIERETAYQADIRRRMALVLAGPEERARESVKAKIGDLPFDEGSLFAALNNG